MTILTYKGHAIQVKDGQYRLIIYPYQWFPSYELITNHIDKLIQAANDKA